MTLLQGLNDWSLLMLRICTQNSQTSAVANYMVLAIVQLNYCSKKGFSCLNPIQIVSISYCRVTCFWGYKASRAVKNLLKQHVVWKMFEDEQVITFQLKVKFKHNFRGYFWDSVRIWEILEIFYPQSTVTLWYHFLWEICLDTGSLLIYIVLVPVYKKGNNYWSSDYYPITLIPYCGQRYGKNKTPSAHQIFRNSSAVMSVWIWHQNAPLFISVLYLIHDWQAYNNHRKSSFMISICRSSWSSIIHSHLSFAP